MDKKIFLTLRDMDDEEYYCVKKVELNSTLEEKIKNELVAIYQEQGSVVLMTDNKLFYLVCIDKKSQLGVFFDLILRFNIKNKELTPEELELLKIGIKKYDINIPFEGTILEHHKKRHAIWLKCKALLKKISEVSG